jgi:hypothetical protein
LVAHADLLRRVAGVVPLVILVLGYELLDVSFESSWGI